MSKSLSIRRDTFSTPFRLVYAPTDSSDKYANAYKMINLLQFGKLTWAIRTSHLAPYTLFTTSCAYQIAITPSYQIDRAIFLSPMLICWTIVLCNNWMSLPSSRPPGLRPTTMFCLVNLMARTLHLTIQSAFIWCLIRRYNVASLVWVTERMRVRNMRISMAYQNLTTLKLTYKSTQPAAFPNGSSDCFPFNLRPFRVE